MDADDAGSTNSSRRQSSEVTLLLRASAGGSSDAGRELLPLVYAELRALAASYLRRERPGHTLQPTALVHEAFVRLVHGAPIEARDRQHFLALAAGVMRHVLVDHARERKAARHGGDAIRVTLDDAIAASPTGDVDDVLAIHEALEELHALHERQARVVELKFFGGLTISEIASLLDVSTVTIDSDWAVARAWLFRRLKSR
jgi:RNA polymerase sigma-70 factor (ECF subfamily)